MTRHPERGIALVTALLVLLLTAVLAGTFMATSTSERAIASNVHIARASLVAADAGVRVAQQVLANHAKDKLDSLCGAWAGVGPVLTNPSALFPGGVISVSGSDPGFAASATISFADSTVSDSVQTFNYLYTITATGVFGQAGQRQVLSTGILRVSAERGSFADFLLFVDHYTRPDNTALYMTSSVTYDGRLHSNDFLSFAYQPTFHDLVTQSNPRARYFNAGRPTMLDASSNGTTDNPNFYGGFTRGVPVIPLPANSFNQQNAALARGGGVMVPPTTGEIEAALGLPGGGGVPDGVYLVTDGGGAVSGGIYVQGNLERCVAAADTATGQQTYRMTQGGTTTTITIDHAAGTTTVDRGMGPVTHSGAPNGLIFVDGSVADLSGPGRSGSSPLPAIARDHQMLIASTGNVKINGDLTVQDFDTAVGVMGIFTPNGNVYVGRTAPNDLYLDLFIMATGPTSIFEVENYGSGGTRGRLNMRGGVVTTYKGAYGTMNVRGTLLHGYAANARFDRRGVAPPYFPTTGRFTANLPRARTLAWKEI